MNSLNYYESKVNHYNRYMEKSVELNATIYLFLLNSPKIYKNTEKKLIGICNQIMHPQVGFKIYKVETRPFISEMSKKRYNKEHFRELINHINSSEFEITSEKKYLNIKDTFQMGFMKI